MHRPDPVDILRETIIAAAEGVTLLGFLGMIALYAALATGQVPA